MALEMAERVVVATSLGRHSRAVPRPKGARPRTAASAVVLDFPTAVAPSAPSLRARRTLSAAVLVAWVGVVGAAVAMATRGDASNLLFLAAVGVACAVVAVGAVASRSLQVAGPARAGVPAARNPARSEADDGWCSDCRRPMPDDGSPCVCW